MPSTRYYLRYRETGVRVIHNEGYVYAFSDPADAAASARGLKNTYKVDTYIAEVLSDSEKLPLTPVEREILRDTPPGVLPGSVYVGTPDVRLAAPTPKGPVVARGRNIRIRKGN